MIVCPNCGNKRCPRASDHNFICTESNEPGQIGSVWGPNTLPPEKEIDWAALAQQSTPPAVTGLDDAIEKAAKQLMVRCVSSWFTPSEIITNSILPIVTALESQLAEAKAEREERKKSSNHWANVASAAIAHNIECDGVIKELVEALEYCRDNARFSLIHVANHKFGVGPFDKISAALASAAALTKGSK